MYQPFIRRLLSALLLLTLTACANGLSGKPKMAATSVTGVGHLGRMTGIPRYSVDGHWCGNVPSWGGGGGSACWVEVPAEKPSTPYMVKVQWRTCDISHIKFVDGKRANPNDRCIPSEHEATVPVHYAESELGNLAVHFLPGNKIEVWSSNRVPNGSGYPGPAYSRGPAPDYAPVVDDPATVKNQGGQ